MVTLAQPTFNTVDPDELYVCPYDPVHRISAKRLPYHLSKCRKIHNAKDYVRCPFNARHEIPRQELEFHVSTCPDKDVIRQDFDSAPAYIPQSSNRPATPPPTQGIVEASEDWDSEPVSEHFVPSKAGGFHNSERVDSYAVVQMLSEAQEELHGSTPAPANVNLADMTPAQKKNYKRALKRQQKRAEENGEEEGPQMTDQEKVDAIVKKYPLMSGKEEGGFVDFVSRLNIHCQQNKINCPKYREAPGVHGGFGYQVIVQTDVFSTNKYCKTKKEAKQNAAMVAFLGLDIKFGAAPIPNRPNASLTAKEKQRMRETHEKLMLREAGYHNPGPAVMQQPSRIQQAQQPAQINQAMAAVSISKDEDDGWTTVPSKTGNAPKNPVFDYSLKVAGRGRGIPRR